MLYQAPENILLQNKRSINLSIFYKFLKKKKIYIYIYSRHDYYYFLQYQIFLTHKKNLKNLEETDNKLTISVQHAFNVLGWISLIWVGIF